MGARTAARTDHGHAKHAQPRAYMRAYMRMLCTRPTSIATHPCMYISVRVMQVNPALSHIYASPKPGHTHQCMPPLDPESGPPHAVRASRFLSIQPGLQIVTCHLQNSGPTVISRRRGMSARAAAPGVAHGGALRACAVQHGAGMLLCIAGPLFFPFLSFSFSLASDIFLSSPVFKNGEQGSIR